jgi:hypothetical protein
MDHFVRKACEGRDPSHGYEHMDIVRNTALKIFDHDVPETHPNYRELRGLTSIVGLFHDVFDHKYDLNGELKVECQKFLEIDTMTLIPNYDVKLIIDIIDRISFSKENKCIKENKSVDWLEKLGDDGLLVRNIVSDADKLEAIGPIGIERCAMYTMAHQKNQEECTDFNRTDLKAAIVKHADEKLRLIASKFIRTPYGKILATPLNDKMEEILATGLDDFLDNCKIQFVSRS